MPLMLNAPNRRQFLITQRERASRPGWISMPIGNGEYMLQFHHDLNVVQIARGGWELTLLGFMLDPHNPESSDRTILEAIISQLDDGDIHQATYHLGGRWLLVVHHASSALVVPDAAGLRQLFYADVTLPEFCCASQALHIASALELQVSADFRSRFLESAYVANDPEYWFPGDSSPYLGVRALLPNHALDLRARCPRRFWPSKPLERVSADEGVAGAAALLSGMVRAAANRFALAVPVTAGVDSRVVVAATRSVSEAVYYYTFRHPRIEPNDLTIPQHMLGASGLEHHVLDCRGLLSRTFAEISRSSLDAPHEARSAVIERLQGIFPEGKLVLQGHVSEIVRDGYYYFFEGHPEIVTPKFLAERARMIDEKGAPIAFALDRFGEWLADSADPCCANGIRLLDLFYWEQRVGVWAAGVNTAFDHVYEQLTIFNSREWIVLMLGVDERLRAGLNWGREEHAYVMIIQRLWPDLLAWPINPPSWSFRRSVVVVLERFRLLQPARALYRVTGAAHRWIARNLLS